MGVLWEKARSWCHLRDSKVNKNCIIFFGSFCKLSKKIGNYYLPWWLGSFTTCAPSSLSRLNSFSLAFFLLQFPLPHPLINSLKVLDFQVFASTSSFSFFFSHWCWPSLSETFGWRFSNHSTYQQPLFHHLASENINTFPCFTDIFNECSKIQIVPVEMSTLLLINVFPREFFNECSKRKLGEWGRRISYNAVYNDLHILWENQIYETSTLFTEKENVSSYLNAPKTLSPQKCRSAEEIMVLPTTDEMFKLFSNFCSYVKISQKFRLKRWMTSWIGGSFCTWK